MAEPERPPCPIGDGGGGGPSDDRKTADLTRRAIKERWPIPDGVRQQLARYLVGIVETSEDDRARVAAARAVLAADALNMEQEKRDLQIPERVELTGRDGGPMQHEHRTIVERIAARRAAILRAASGAVRDALERDGVREPVDPRPYQSGTNGTTN